MTLVTDQEVLTPKSPKKSPSPWVIARRKFFKNKLALISLIFLLIVIILSFLAPYITTKDIVRVDFTQISKPPSSENWLGTDTNGRDVFTRMLYAGRSSLTVGLSCMFFIVLIGTTVGAISGYFGGKIDQILMRFTDFILMFPFMIFVIVLNQILIGKVSGLWTLIFVISLLMWGSVARIVRSRVLAEKENEYILAAQSIGCKSSKIIMKHLLPNVASTIIVQATLLMAVTIVAESGLSFLGLGVPADTPSWGNMLSEARNSEVLKEKLWMWVPPATAITLVILSINFIGEGLKDALNPKSRR
ncbi:ABC transporter permease [Lysinibacillus sp. OL1_EC]|uniref:ABC transporter permease n=2 Tax=Lysinibacillus capsici TaxID=2115968 RepID=A0A2X0YWT1_9BACI|nr:MULTISPECIES: oligopeptide ABC transporter permease [Lysinibacillus]KMN37152.1 peptide ABC transporter permease [Lysinibacillus sp. LK3]MBX8943016.1 ABC transporter permease [Lysinibacillus sp. K60]MCM0625744.1 ABC transporter permease [Lysinibacillus sp. OL1_EC]MCR6523473.1 ABC transporter permease [Lysinibacillus capsici]MCS1391567.1 ABC transporter permease [Lysinibacillus boronitolerans]